MNALRPRLTVALIGIVWAVVFTRPELLLSTGIRGLVLLAILVVTAVLFRYIGSDEGPSFLGPLAVFSNLLFGATLILALRPRVSSSVLFLMLLMLVQMLLFFFLSVTHKRISEEKSEASNSLLNEKTQQLLYLQQVGIAMNSAEEIKSFLDVVLQATSHITKAERVLLFLDKGRGELTFEAGHATEGYHANIVELQHNPILQRVLAEGASVLAPIPDADHFDLLDVDERQLANVAIENSASFMIMPLVRKDGCWGVFYAERVFEDGLSFNLVDLEVFRVLASQISVALENADLYFRMRESYRHTIEALAAAIEAKDVYTSGHSSAVTRYAVPVAQALGVIGPELESIEFAAILHDIGKIAVPESVLNKPGKLTREEFEDIKRHPAIGAEIIRSVGFLSDAVAFIKHHHERWDGKGYPDGLAGDDIPLGAQIVGIVDTFDAMTSTRSYRKALPADEAIKEIQRCSGTQFNPAVVQAFMQAFEAGSIQTDDDRADYGFTKTSSFRLKEAEAS